MKKRFLLLAAAMPMFLGGCIDNTFPEEESLGGSALYNTPTQTAPAPIVEEVAVSMAAGPKYYVGPQYVIDSTTYFPAENMTYNHRGVAGIILMDLAGNKTANGETFDPNALTATHKTLPLPS